jgi:uncharacterized NAD(P)/FAD-binding protein YdhS/predicted metal-dependent enzyme (double-stranded beta helix superfamily)
MLKVACTGDHRGLSWLISRLDTSGFRINEASVRRLLTQASLNLDEVAPYVDRRSDSYARRSVVRREGYELLVLTWMPGQGSVVHDHSGSLCGLKVVRGSLVEQRYESGPDGQVRATSASTHGPGRVIVDPGLVVHSLSNAASASEVLVTVHLYSPPLPEIRRYALAAKAPSAVFLRGAQPQARVAVTIGGGFTGTMTLSNLLRRAGGTTGPLHFVLIDRQPAVGEGAAYRTNDSRHLLNVPAGQMSAWPDRPDDFLNFARAQDPSVKPGDFIPRRLYGRYVRQTLLDLAESSGSAVSVEIIREDATGLAHGSPSGDWIITTASGRTIRADVAIVALGHRPPDEPFSRRWKGPRNRLVNDPWAALVLSQIGPDEPVLLMGSGLTAVDAILTLDRPDRTAPLMAVSRRGLLPQAHAREPRPAADLSRLMDRCFDMETPLTVRGLLRLLREAAWQPDMDWRQVIDGLRPFTARLWDRLSQTERARFLRHVRPFWEIHRHRMAHGIAARIEQLRAHKILDITAGALLSAEADAEGIKVTLSRRGRSDTRQMRVSWVINCTGPGTCDRWSIHPILRPLIQAGVLLGDPLGVGLRTDADGRAIQANGEAHTRLLVAGPLRKSALWESTAVPELRQQAATVAEMALRILTGGLRASAR